MVNKKTKTVVRFLAIGIMLSGMLSCSDSYRYKCQNPDNFGKSECVPPGCLADNSCTSTVLGFDPLLPEQTNQTELVPNQSQDTIPCPCLTQETTAP